MSFQTAFSQVIKTPSCSVDLEIFTLPRCAIVMRDNRTYISTVFVKRLFKGESSDLLSRYLPDVGWAYFDRTGRVRVTGVAPFDNGASGFHFGVVRVERDGKYGLATEWGVLVSRLYDGMNEFDEDQHGWQACSSCRVVKKGEHSAFEGGSWFWLDRKGRVVNRTGDGE